MKWIDIMLKPTPKKMGALKVALVITLLVVILSSVLYLVIAMILGRFLYTGLLISIVLPALIAPCIAYAVLRASFRLALTGDQLSKNEARYRHFFENLHDLFFRADDNGIINMISPSAENILGYQPTALIGANFMEFFDPQEDWERFKKTLREKGSVENFETAFKRHDGSLVYTSTNATIYHDKETDHYGFEGISRDITRRKKNEEALGESEEKYRRLFDEISDFIYTHDLEGRLLDINPMAVRLLGYPLKELVGRPISEFMLPQFQDAFYREYLPSLKEKGYYNGVSKYLAKGGVEHVIEYRNVLVAPEGQDPYVYGIGRDITERIEKQRELRRLEKQLQHAQKMEAIGTLTSGVAHNFRNILAGVLNHSQLIQMRYRNIPHLNDIAERINQNIQKGAQLIEGLMQFSRKQPEADLQPMDLSGIIRETGQLIGRSFDKRIRIHFKGPEMLPVMGHPSALSQVFVNLCNNARDAMPTGGDLRIEAEIEMDQVIVTVSDTGCGMDRETMDKCFDPFFTSKEVDKGTGLGLSTAYGIIQEHGGEIRVDSQLGQGTTFTLSLPLAAASGYEEKPEGSEIVNGRGQKILIVDDESDVLLPLQELLKSLGYATSIALSGSEAINKFTAWKPDVVLLDRNMPEMDGARCAQKIFELDPLARIVIVSGYDEDGSGPEEMDESVKAAIKGYLTKPIDLAELTTEVNRALR